MLHRPHGPLIVTLAGAGPLITSGLSTGEGTKFWIFCRPCAGSGVSVTCSQAICVDVLSTTVSLACWMWYYTNDHSLKTCLGSCLVSHIYPKVGVKNTYDLQQICRINFGKLDLDTHRIVKTIIFVGTEKCKFCSQSCKLTLFRVCILDVIILIPLRGKWVFLAEWESINLEMQIEKHINVFQ